MGSYIESESFEDVINHLIDRQLGEKNTSICRQTITLLIQIMKQVPGFVFERIDDYIGFICEKGVESSII